MFLLSLAGLLCSTVVPGYVARPASAFETPIEHIVHHTDRPENNLAVSDRILESSKHGQVAWTTIAVVTNPVPKPPLSSLDNLNHLAGWHSARLGAWRGFAQAVG
ncbi:hypothetical protein ONZ51_g13275 [Trametes cubensis]|uniref:Uncharacterized protein n=1 Tax=Trametes cubensis TaxID=1111947 RepID=A0AAD7X635_9APHY|nr:hypothetical protein ONZ51_g13275 [Trametes cubensis]